MNSGSVDDDLSSPLPGIDQLSRNGTGLQPQQVRFRDVRGELCKATFVAGEMITDRPGTSARGVTVDGRALQQHYVALPAGGRRVDEAAAARLEAEVRALCRLAQCYRSAPEFPVELPHIVGYNVDVAEPFLLVEPYRGRPAAGVVRQLDGSDKIAFQQSLVRALALVEAAQVAHGGIALPALRWHGAGIQLVDFTHATILDRGMVSDDVRDVGAVIRELLIGPLAARDPRHDPPQVQETLRGVFATDPAARPRGVDLLTRLHAPAITVPFTDPRAAFEPGRAEFERISTLKRGGDPAVPAQRPMPGDTGPTRRPPAAPPPDPGPTEPVRNGAQSTDRPRRRRFWGSTFGLMTALAAMVLR